MEVRHEFLANHFRRSRWSLSSVFLVGLGDICSRYIGYGVFQRISFRRAFGTSRLGCGESGTNDRCARFGNQAANVSTQSEQAHTEANTRIQTIFKDRFVYITREAKNAKAENPACTIPTRFISVWNSANRAEPIPEASGQSDDSASGITLDDIAAQHDREAEQYHINAQRLSDLQHWVNEQVRVSEEVSK